MTQPNLLWIFVDEHRGSALACAGDPNLDTPNIDRLQAEGVRFANAYSNTPICTPARGTVYTGRYISNHSAKANHYPLLPDHSPQMAEVMAAAGYHCGHHGKWHLSGGSVNQHFVSPFFRPGWHDWVGWECMHGLAETGTYYDTTYGEGHIAIRANKIVGFQTDWLTDRTLAWLDERPADEPWFHCISIETPHPPVDAPNNVSPEHYALFADKEIELRANVPEEMRDKAVEFLRGYYSHVANIDDNVGRILAKLEERNELENTIIVFFADHGDMASSHGQYAGKSNAYEESAGIPFILRLPESLAAPRRDGEHVCEGLISLVDLMPTCLALCGIDIPRACDGSDYSALVRGDTDEGGDSVYMQFENNYWAQRYPQKYWRAIRVGDWKYNINLEDGPAQLFDLRADPYEMNNLIQDPAHAGKREELHAAMQAKAQALGDDFFARLQASLVSA